MTARGVAAFASALDAEKENKDPQAPSPSAKRKRTEKTDPDFSLDDAATAAEKEQETVDDAELSAVDDAEECEEKKREERDEKPPVWVDCVNVAIFRNINCWYRYPLPFET